MEESGKAASNLVRTSCRLTVTLAIAVAQLYVGIANLDRCPAEPMIPVYLVGTMFNLSKRICMPQQQVT